MIQGRSYLYKSRLHSDRVSSDSKHEQHECGMFCSESDEQAQRDVKKEEHFAHHMPRSKVFIEARKGCEAAKIRNETLQDFVGCPGRALLGGAMPSSMIYWSFIDPHLHSFFATIEQKVELLSPCREGAKSVGQKKMEKSEEHNFNELYFVHRWQARPLDMPPLADSAEDTFHR